MGCRAPPPDDDDDFALLRREPPESVLGRAGWWLPRPARPYSGPAPPPGRASDEGVGRFITSWPAVTGRNTGRDMRSRCTDSRRASSRAARCCCRCCCRERKSTAPAPPPPPPTGPPCLPCPPCPLPPPPPPPLRTVRPRCPRCAAALLPPAAWGESAPLKTVGGPKERGAVAEGPPPRRGGMLIIRASTAQNVGTSVDDGMGAAGPGRACARGPIRSEVPCAVARRARVARVDN